jgi:hypothetical protein
MYLSWLSLSIALLLTVLIPSDQSLWIDEAQTARYAAEPTFSGVIEKLSAATDNQSDAQMPLGVMSAWGAARVLGTGEWDLRAPNIAWAMIAVVGLWQTARRIRVRGLELVFAVHPFVWFYVNEARPYAMQLAAGSWLLFALVDLLHAGPYSRRWVWAYAVSALVLGGASMLGLVAVAAVSLVMLAVIHRRSWSVPRASWLPIAVTVTILTTLSGYYLWTLARGVGGAKLWSPGLGNIALAVYEFAGFAGIGPSRQEIRDLSRTGALFDVSVVAPFVVPALALGLAIAVIAFAWIRQLRAPNRDVLVSITAVPVIAVAVLFVASIAVGFPFWGRHLAGVLPFVIAGGALALSAQPRLVVSCVTLALVASYGYSSAQLRYSARHSKDDYRTAAYVAKAALDEGRSVWWSADTGAAIYYGVPLTRTEDRSAARALLNRTPAEVRAAALPDIALMSKPDIYDRSGSIAEVLQEHGYSVTRELQAFSLWERTGPMTSSRVQARPECATPGC